MASIRKIEDSLIPKDAIVCKNGMKTKKIYLKNDANEFFNFYSGFSVEEGSILIAFNETEKMKTRKEYSDKIGEWIYIDLFNADTRIAYERVGDIVRSNSYPNGSYLVEFSSFITINSDFNGYFYCIPEKTIELKPMPKIDKLIDSSSFENVSTKLQEINNLLKIGSDNLKTIMDANTLMYKNSNKLIELIKDLNNKTSILVDGVTFYETIVSQIKGFDDIENIKFIKMDKELNGVDVSLDGNTKANKIDKTLYVESNRKIAGNKKCSDMFTTIFLSLKTVDFENFYASNVIDMSYMFYYVSTLTNLLNFKSINTKNVTNMTGMFQKCTSLQSIDFSNIDLSNVTDISSMFQECTSLQYINGLNKIEFKKVTNYAAAFFKCNKLNGEITISNHSINNYLNMFYDCSTEPNTKFTVNYIDEETKKIAEQMVATKSPESNVILGKLVTQ